ncbi:MAG: biopolymer transporter ExbB [Deltaproteobacteria bacterium]|mgnify:CR=1 FL=1|jgi:biopolymer transport protein ExbB|nr:Biopolymer transport protein ExbB [bacterium HR37]GIW48478.1 MAG: biopolymer transporter ExbB [Deltaproteobacteria bacterium]
MIWDSSVFEFIRKGGIFMYPILLCSIVGLSIFLQKMWVLRVKKILPEEFLKQFYEFLSQGRIGEALVLSRSNDSSIARIATVALENACKTKEELREDIESAGRREVQELERYIEGLGAISNVSTLLGLLGTISGMIKIFRVISEQPIVDPPSLAGGISEALYTTAFGLLVAIPTFIAYKYTMGKAESLVVGLEEEGRRIMEEVINANEKAVKSREVLR